MRLNKRGSVNVIIVVIFAFLVSMAAVVVDIGVSYHEAQRLQASLDLAALAGALELPEDSVSAENHAINYMNLNFPEVLNLTVNISSDNREIEVLGTVNVDYKFARIMGFNERAFDRRAKVIIGPLSSVYTGLRPLAIEQATLEFGDEVILKDGAFESEDGNFGAVGLGGSGASIFKDNILFGYNGEIAIGDEIPTEPGNMPSVINPLKDYLKDDFSTFDNFTRTSKRLWVIPVIDSFDVAGKEYVTVVAFAQFFIEDIGKQGGQTNIYGRFVKYVNAGSVDVNGQDNGIYGTKLVE